MNALHEVTKFRERKNVLQGVELNWQLNRLGNYTIAIVKDAMNENRQGIGIAKCNPIDTFVIDVGQRIALNRALHHFVRGHDRVSIG